MWSSLKSMTFKLSKFLKKNKKAQDFFFYCAENMIVEVICFKKEEDGIGKSSLRMAILNLDFYHNKSGM